MQSSSSTAFDRDEMLERLGGDAELLQDVLEVFLEECPRMMGEIVEAVSGQDVELVRRSAHSIKGALLNISAGAAAEEATRLEAMAAEASLDGSYGALERLRTEIDRLQNALAEQSAG